jgi:uncharacterized protein (TIGR03437 family)
MRPPVRILAAALLAAVSSQAAYHYVHYPSRTNFTPIYEKFDLAALPNNTVSVFVQDQGPANFAPNDSFGSIVAQIRQAAAAWNSVTASDLRVAFGGLETYTPSPTAANPGNPVPKSKTPGIDVIFVDIPGLVAAGGPTYSLAQPQSAPFVPITGGVVMLSRDTSLLPPSGAGPSYTEGYFTTVVHEIGHALGLQHTWTSSAMSQADIRNTSRARAVDADDIASLATLYGQSHLQTSYGSISGRVTFANNGQGVSLASVVAISPNGPAVSTLTNPDGTYQIVGLPPNFSYLVYAHPLPPDALSGNGPAAESSGLRLPVDQNSQSFAASGSFVTTFSAGGGLTQDPRFATSYPIAAGSSIQNVNFSVQARTGVPASDLTTYSRYSVKDGTYYWPGDYTVQGFPAFIDINKNAGVIIVGPNTAGNTMPTPQSVTMLGFTPATLGSTALPLVIPYTDGSAIAVYYSIPPGTPTGPRHLVFNFGSDIYVFPYSVALVDSGPPSISLAAANGDGTVTIAGLNLGPDTRVYFDSMQAQQGPFNGNSAVGSIAVAPPQGASGQVATITAYNSDGQNSLILYSTTPAIPSAAPPTFTYPSTFGGQLLSVTPASLPAGSSAAVDIIATGTNFVDGQVSVGFGSDDVTVRRVWVLSPTHLVANVVVASNAALGLSELSVVSGMQVLSQANAFQVQQARNGVPAIALPVVNAVTGAEQLLPGGFGTIYGQNLGTLGAANVTLNGQTAIVIFDNGTQVNFLVPSGFPSGPASLVLAAPGGSTLPVMVQVYASVPVITAVNTPGGPLSTGTILSPDDTIMLTAAGLDPSLANGLTGRVRVTIAGVDMAVQQVVQLAPGTFQIQAVVTQSFGASQAPLALIVDGSSSAPVNVVVK